MTPSRHEELHDFVCWGGGRGYTRDGKVADEDSKYHGEGMHVVRINCKIWFCTHYLCMVSHKVRDCLG